MMAYVNAAYLNKGGTDNSTSINHGVVWFICRRENKGWCLNMNVKDM